MNTTLLGKRVLAGLNRGRAIAIANTRVLSTARAVIIYRFAVLDMQTSFPARGRPGRIARHSGIPEVTVWRYLKKLSFTQIKVKGVARIDCPSGPARKGIA